MISKDSKTLQVTLPKEKYEFLEMCSKKGGKTKSAIIDDLVTMLYGLLIRDLFLMRKEDMEKDLEKNLKKGENRNA